MLNLDNSSIEELEEFVQKSEQDKVAFAKELFPDKPPGFVKALNGLEKYAKAKIEAMKDRLNGRIQRALKHEEECEKFYRILPDYAKW